MKRREKESAVIFRNDSACFSPWSAVLTVITAATVILPCPRNQDLIQKRQVSWLRMRKLPLPMGSPSQTCKGSMVLPTIIIHHSNGCCSGFSPDSLFTRGIPDSAPFLLIQLFLDYTIILFSRNINPNFRSAPRNADSSYAGQQQILLHSTDT